MEVAHDDEPVIGQGRRVVISARVESARCTSMAASTASA